MLQAQSGTGPCVDCIDSGKLVSESGPAHSLPDIDHAGISIVRWPRFIQRAIAEGVRSQLGIRLYADNETLGALNLYSMSSDTIDEAHAFAYLARVSASSNVKLRAVARELVRRRGEDGGDAEV